MARDQIVEIEVPNLAQIQERLGDMQHKTPTVMARTINSTIKQLSSMMAKEAQLGYWVKVGAVKKTMSIKKAAATRLSGEVISKSNEKVKLFGFKATPKVPQPAAPPTFYQSQVKKKTGLKILDGSGDRSAAFVAKMSSGHTGIFQRRTDIIGTSKQTARTASRQKSKFRNRADNPIKELYGPSIPSMFATKQMSTEVVNKGQKLMHEILDKEIQKMLEAGK